MFLHFINQTLVERIPHIIRKCVFLSLWVRFPLKITYVSDEGMPTLVHEHYSKQSNLVSMLLKNVELALLRENDRIFLRQNFEI